MHRVVVGALLRDGHVLLAHRSPLKRAYPDVWDLPGGLIEAGEPELDALERELREELGVDVATRSASHLCRVALQTADGGAVMSAWLVQEWTGTPTNAAPDEHVDIGWFRVEELPPLAHPQVRTTVVDALQDAYKSARGAGPK